MEKMTLGPIWFTAHAILVSGTWRVPPPGAIWARRQLGISEYVWHCEQMTEYVRDNAVQGWRSMDPVPDKTDGVRFS